MAFPGIKIYVSAADSGTIKCEAGLGLVATGPAVNIVDGEKHKIVVVQRIDSLKVYIDGVPGVEDTAGDPTLGGAPFAIDIAQSYSAHEAQANGCVSNLKVYKKYVAKP